MVRIDNRKKEVSYFDPKGDYDKTCTGLILDYLSFRQGYPGVHSNYSLKKPNSFKKQLNSHDCGPLVLTYAVQISQDQRLSISLKDMPQKRVKLAFELLANVCLIPPNLAGQDQVSN